MDTLDLSAFFKTKLQARDFSSRLSLLISRIYSNDFNMEKELQEQFGIEKRDKFITLLRDHGLSAQATAPLKDFLDNILKTILELPVLTLTLAFEPKQVNLAAFAEWFQLNIKRQILLDIKVDPNLIGGALVAFDGKYLDGTVRVIFEEISRQAFEHPSAPPAQAAAAPSPSSSPQPDHPAALPLEHMHLGR